MKGYSRSLFTLLLVWLALSWMGEQRAYAHAVPVLSSPQPNEILDSPPMEVSIRFNEPVVPDLSRIMVLTQAGQAVTVGPTQATDADNRTLAVSLPDLGDGAYLVSWQALSAVDGHTTSGSFSFGVGAVELTAVSTTATTSALVSPLNVVARWFTFTGTVLLLGLFAFRLFVWNPIFTTVDLEASEEQLDLTQARASLKIGLVATAFLGVGLLLIFIYQTSTYDLLQGGNFRAWLATPFGQAWLRRGLLALAAGLNLADLSLGIKEGRRSLHGWSWWIGLVLASGVALTSSLVSHSAALTQARLVATAVDFAHIIAASLWVGGLFYLALGLWQARALPSDSRAWLNLSLILNFSALAAMAVGLLLVSGGYLAWQHVGNWTALVGTAYGLTLLAKLALALPAFAIAGLNLLVIKPRLDAAFEAPEAAASTAALHRFGRLVRLEALLALLVLLAAGVLIEQQRAKEAPLLADAPGRMEVTTTADDLTITLAIEPALVGQNSFDVYLADAASRPVTDASEVLLRFTFLDQSLGAAEGTAVSQGNGHYQLEGSYISLIGQWQVEVAVRRPGTFDTFAPYRLEAALGGKIQPLTGGGTRLAERFTRFMTLVGGAAVGAALVLLAIGWGFIATRAAKSEWQLLPLLAISIFAFWLGATQLFNYFTYDFTPSRFLTNPIVPDATSIATGRQLFEENCVTCHGPTGRGDGPAAAALQPRPADFAGGHTATHPDGDLYFWIRNGIENTQMPGFAEQLTPEETWHLVNYVRRLSTQSVQVAQ